MNEFLENNGTKNISAFEGRGAGQLTASLFEHHDVSPYCLDDEDMILEVMEIRKTGTWNDLNSWIENNF